MLLRDPVGTVFQVAVKYWKGYLCMYQGWSNIGWYYGLPFGGWVQMTFHDQTTLLIRVRDSNFRQVYYPRPAIHISIPNVDGCVFVYHPVVPGNDASHAAVSNMTTDVVGPEVVPSNEQFMRHEDHCFFHCMSMKLVESDLSKLVRCFV